MTRSMLSCGWLIAANLIGCLDAQAQERLLLLRDTGLLAEIDTSDTTFGSVIRQLRFPPSTNAVAVAGGRHLLLSWRQNRTGPTLLGVMDTRTFGASPVPEWTFPGGVSIESDDFRPRFFYRTPTAVGVVEGPTFRPRELSSAVEIARPDSFTCCGPLEYAEALKAIILTRDTSATSAEIIVIDAHSGMIRRASSVAGLPLALAADNATRTLWVAMRVNLIQTELHMYDLETLALVNRSETYTRPMDASWTFDVSRRRMLTGVSGGGSPDGPYAFAVNAALATEASVSFSYLAFNPPLAWLPLTLRSSTVRDRVFASVSRGDYDSSGGIQPGKAFVVALDGTTLQPLTTVDLLQHPDLFEPGGGDAILLNPPPRPSSLNATVDTRRVRFQWNDSGDATHFQLEVGSSSGQADLGVLVIQSATTFVTDNAPSGRYFVRVRAVNDVGVSLASNEVTVLVP